MGRIKTTLSEQQKAIIDSEYLQINLNELALKMCISEYKIRRYLKDNNKQVTQKQKNKKISFSRWKLNYQQRKSVIIDRKDGLFLRELSDKYNVSDATIRRVLNKAQ